MVLNEIAERTRQRVEEEKTQVSELEMRQRAETLEKGTGRPLENAFLKEDFSFICEVKKASPSKGIMVEDFPYIQIAREYEAAGAAAISVLTEPYFFLGRDQYLTEISREVKIPILRKDFTIDPYQIYQAKVIGASAVLLICSLLTTDQLKEFTAVAHGLGLSTLVEAHTEEEIAMALESGTEMIGVNNRDLKTFQVDIANSARLRKLVPQHILFVSESGIKTAEDIDRLRENGTDGALIGETLMKSSNKKQMLDQLRGRQHD